MRKLKLQMQMTVDGFVAGPEGQLDWMTFEEDAPLLAFINDLIDTSDTILMGRKMAGGFLRYWESVKPDSPELTFAQKMVDTPKIVFSHTIETIEGKNVSVETRSLVEAINQLKSEPGKDLLVYGGASFVSSLLDHDLLDELHLFINPVAIGGGMQIFKNRKPLKLTGSTAYDGGKVVNTYRVG